MASEAILRDPTGELGLEREGLARWRDRKGYLADRMGEQRVGFLHKVLLGALPAWAQLQTDLGAKMEPKVDAHPGLLHAFAPPKSLLITHYGSGSENRCQERKRKSDHRFTPPCSKGWWGDR